jgi:hypothetical protein
MKEKTHYYLNRQRSIQMINMPFLKIGIEGTYLHITKGTDEKSTTVV